MERWTPLAVLEIELARAVFATIGALGCADVFPGPGDFETRFAPVVGV